VTFYLYGRLIESFRDVLNVHTMVDISTCFTFGTLICSERKWKVTAQRSVQFYICTLYDTAVWVRHPMLAQEPASDPGDCSNGKNLSVIVGNLVFTTAMRTESFKFSGVVVLCFLAEIIQDAGLGESSPIFRFRNLTSLKKMVTIAIQTAKSLILECICCLCVYICVALKEVNTWRLAKVNSNICRHSCFLSALHHGYQNITL